MNPILVAYHPINSKFMMKMETFEDMEKAEAFIAQKTLANNHCHVYNYYDSYKLETKTVTFKVS